MHATDPQYAEPHFTVDPSHGVPVPPLPPPPPGYPARRPTTHSAPASEWAWPPWDPAPRAAPPAVGREWAHKTADASRARGGGPGAVDPGETRETAGSSCAGRAAPRETVAVNASEAVESRQDELMLAPSVQLAPIPTSAGPRSERIATTATTMAGISTAGFESPAPRAAARVVESWPAMPVSDGVSFSTTPAHARAAADAEARRDQSAAHRAHVGSARPDASGAGHGHGHGDAGGASAASGNDSARRPSSTTASAATVPPSTGAAPPPVDDDRALLAEVKSRRRRAALPESARATVLAWVNEHRERSARHNDAV
ncbi:hypothetical protein AMAG_20077 [Allomyces macrogynus ATCC 38327]|uniref:Uncharacterized protein n=1 Tax=Allomyces macrogynus (strain ATCC 38327) TaxID=578462 RepID=A0A0L0T6A2_ALLM3|nr:hypothetical protein AMAG_20077 [Allomyces macrogynus ATCC 38327]|eukprot:KNE70287.1 hypothetical protein AMAG_20077 [Allomyces macrogynus ATCC 38327]